MSDPRADAGADDTYALGQTIRVAVTFSEAVEVDTSGGTPGLSIDMDPADWGEKRAARAAGPPQPVGVSILT